VYNKKERNKKAMKQYVMILDEFLHADKSINSYPVNVSNKG
jgi:hypothetical protein